MTEPMKILRLNKESLVLDYYGRNLILVGEITNHGFMAMIDPMNWILPHSVKVPVARDDAMKIANAVTQHFSDDEFHIKFVDSSFALVDLSQILEGAISDENLETAEDFSHITNKL